MKTLYVVWQDNHGGFRNSIIEVSGKINNLSVERAVRMDLSWQYRNDIQRVISWQETEEFDLEEERKFFEEDY